MNNGTHEKKSDSVFPAGLVEKYHSVIQDYARTGNLSAVATKINVIITLLVPDSAPLSRLLDSTIRWSYLYFAGMIASVVLCFMVSWWFLVAAVIAFGMYRNALTSILVYREMLATMLLSTEVLAHDFAGWGAAYPDARKSLLRALTVNDGEFKGTEWLDRVFPDRANYSQTKLRSLGPDV